MTLAQLGTFTLEASVVLAAALAAVGLLSRTSAPVRHWVLAVAVWGSLALPLLETLLPAWRIAPAATVVSLDGTDAAEAVVVDERFVMPLATGSASTTESPRRAARWPSLAMPVWLTGVLVGSVIMLAGLARLRWLAGHAHPVTHGPWAECWCDLARADRAIPAATLLQSTHGSLLVTWGWTPKILLPADAAGWDRPRIEAVLSHEAAHIRRHDWFLQLSADVLRTILWFNPLAWIAAARLRLESERACDDAVLASGIAPPEYASHLVDIARTLSRSRTWAPAPGMARTSSLERRVSAMLDTQVSRRPLTRFLRFAVTVPLVALTASIASFAAQTSFATLSGTVRDPLGGTIPGVTLALTHAQSGARHEVRTDQPAASSSSDSSPATTTSRSSGSGSPRCAIPCSSQRARPTAGISGSMSGRSRKPSRSAIPHRRWRRRGVPARPSRRQPVPPRRTAAVSRRRERPTTSARSTRVRCGAPVSPAAWS